MIDIYEFVENCKAKGMNTTEASREYEKAWAEDGEVFLDSYYNDPEVQYGWYQQDMIDLRRRER